MRLSLLTAICLVFAAPACAENPPDPPAPASSANPPGPAAPASYEKPPDPAAAIAEQSASMTRLAFIDGAWRGVS
ncbi:MAG: hypothetical protein M3177_08565, partial [Pseudomonadota bacterium]|nr:hypothetical protein [Pseudomonadota bacterium]